MFQMLLKRGHTLIYTLCQKNVLFQLTKLSASFNKAETVIFRFKHQWYLCQLCIKITGEEHFSCHSAGAFLKAERSIFWTVSDVALFHAHVTGATRDSGHVQPLIVMSSVCVHADRETVSILSSRNGISLSHKCCLISYMLLWSPATISGVMQMKAAPTLVLMWPKWRQTPPAKHIWVQKRRSSWLVG